MIDAFLTVTTASIGIIVMGLVMFVSGWLVYKRDRDRISNFTFFILATVASLWSISLGIFELAESPILEKIFLKVLYSLSATLPMALLYFATTLSAEYKRLPKKMAFVSAIPYIALLLIIIGTESVVDTSGTGIGIGKEILFGSNFMYFGGFLVVYLAFAFVVLLKRYLESAGVFRIQIRYILMSVIFATVVTLSVNLFLPSQGSFDLFWAGPLIILATVVLISYLIIKYNFWNPKLYATELFVVLIIAFLSSEILFVNSGLDFAVKITVLVLVGVSSVMLIRSVRSEIESKEEVERLLKDLASTNDELRILDARKSEFISIASHHLRDPLTAIKGYASMLLEGTFGTLSAASADALNKIFESSKRLVVIIEDFMDISKIEAGRMRYEFAPVNMDKLVEGVVEEMRQSVANAGLDINFEKEEGKSYEAKADLGKIRQVISNLIDNAVKYTPSGEVRVKLWRDDKKHSIILCVADTGIGMTPETMEKIFHKFSRADDVSKQYTDGSGLGLYVAKEIVQKHSGRIWAESEGLGHGSKFFVELNVAG